MIRVTLKKGKCYDYIYIEKVKNGIEALETYDDIPNFISWKIISKIEKQVKDLTLDECRKLKAYMLYDDGVEEWYLAVLVFKDGKLVDEDIYRLDDYIDITGLVKEDKSE